MKTTSNARAVLTAVLALCLSFSLIGLASCESSEMKSAKEALSEQTTRIKSEVEAIQKEIPNAEALSATEEKPLDPQTITALQDTISTMKTIKFAEPKTPSSVEEVNALADELKAISYTEQLKSLENAEQAVQDSIEQMKLVTEPTEAYVVERLRTVPDVGEIAAATEDNDPNKHLGKAGGYTAQVFFLAPTLLDVDSIYGSDIIDKGTDAGGSIEVYKTEEDATKRDTYLAAFDGSILANGSHKVIGTVVVRTSDKLTASQQNQLEAEIIDALTRLS